MKTQVILCSRDAYLARKIELEVGGYADFLAVTSPDLLPKDEGALLLWDLGSFESGYPEDAVFLSKSGEFPAHSRVLPLPLPIGAVEGLLLGKSRKNSPRLLLSEGEKCAFLDGERIAFSDTEFALLSLLCRANGEAVARDVIAKEVFSEENSQSLTNVYVHYLREKLEKNGEKIIKSERGSGYRIDRRFLDAKNDGKGE